MKKLTKKIIATISAATIAVLCVPGYAANPGSSDDPLISLSYVNDVLIPQIQLYVDNKLPKNGSLGANAYSTGGNFEVVNVKKGQTIIGSKSCQFILRMGSGKIVSSAKGGIADVTSGADLTTGYAVPSNHLLIVPVDDWRGVTMTTDGILMINGTYSVN